MWEVQSLWGGWLIKLVIKDSAVARVVILVCPCLIVSSFHRTSVRVAAEPRIKSRDERG